MSALSNEFSRLTQVVLDEEIIDLARKAQVLYLTNQPLNEMERAALFACARAGHTSWMHDMVLVVFSRRA